MGHQFFINPLCLGIVYTSMDTLEKGTFTIYGGEDVNVFLNPKNDAFLQFSANGKTYYMGGVDDTQTKGIYEELLTH